MTLPTATVLRVDDRHAVVRVDGAPACARCAAGQGCGAGFTGGRSRPQELTLLRPPGLDLREGDRVSLALEPQRLLKASLLGYGLPLALLLLLPALAEALWGPLADSELALWAGAGLLGAVLAGRRLLAAGRCLAGLAPGIAGRERGAATGA